MLLDVTLWSKSLAASLKGNTDYSRKVHVIQVSNTKGLYLCDTVGKKINSHAFRMLAKY